ncbi:GNAT family N-acetyltransferase [Streptomyces atratus]|uniref:GNAT family N-acetyltransferase n=1 Tax=Streptomyces atratus TaxID=1893 RepID=UPI003570BD68
MADFGVLTLPAFRGNGHGRHVVRALARHALSRGHEPQYRCQLDNHASVAPAA